MRIAELSDMHRLFEWRNGLEVVNFTSNQGTISKTEHEIWFQKRMSKLGSEPIWIFELDNIAIGMTRLDALKSDSGIFEISIIVDTNFKNLGFGTKMIEQSCEFARANLSAKSIYARVHNKNKISIRLFLKLKFKLIYSSLDSIDYDLLVLHL